MENELYKIQAAAKRSLDFSGVDQALSEAIAKAIAAAFKEFLEDRY